ncbi:CatB-related O-acetyltransferase [Parabacteroides sp. FAFU027]|uniref:CatB-related O-acetyltransferase n=1 Tax=Parabacteroides sp. FAFU027 TaxID=2922715 RepID=UPI001FB019D2|nr:CatB-related O-acetyltransferase [Parabacteroides sp. FAFU027]
MPFDRSYLQNPIWEYFKWLFTKVRYQKKYKHLRIGYKTKLSNVKFGEYNWTTKNVIIENSTIGDFSYVSDNCVILESVIGKFCSIGPNVRTAPGKHPTKTIVSTHPAIYSRPHYCLKNFSKTDHHKPYRKVMIGNDVWIAANVIIADGVKIGDGAIIAANSVVTKDIEPYSIVGGTPAKFIRNRFEPKEIEFLLKFEWWNKDHLWIEENVDYLIDIKKFMSLSQYK